VGRIFESLQATGRPKFLWELGKGWFDFAGFAVYGAIPDALSVERVLPARASPGAVLMACPAVAGARRAHETKRHRGVLGK
jgi:hypothetical protein